MTTSPEDAAMMVFQVPSPSVDSSSTGLIIAGRPVMPSTNAFMVGQLSNPYARANTSCA